MADFWNEGVPDLEAERGATRLLWDMETGQFVEPYTPEVKQQRRSKQRECQSGHFLRGPIPVVWLEQAFQLPGKAVNVAVALWYVRGFKQLEPFKLKRETLARFGVARQASYYQALAKLEAARLIQITRKPGQALAVTVILEEPPPPD